MELYNTLMKAVEIASEIAEAEYGDQWTCPNGLGCSWSTNPDNTAPIFIEGQYRNCSDGVERFMWLGVEYTNHNLPILPEIGISFFDKAVFS